MKEAVALIVVLLIFLAFSFKFHTLLNRASPWRFVLFVATYLLCTYVLFEGASSLHNYLRSKGIYFQFGHADESLVFLFCICILLIVINVIAVIIRRGVAAWRLDQHGSNQKEDGSE
jgi:hypothetical protein